MELETPRPLNVLLVHLLFVLGSLLYFGQSAADDTVGSLWQHHEPTPNAIPVQTSGTMNVLPGKKPNMLVPTMAAILPTTVSKACPAQHARDGPEEIGPIDANQHSTEEGAGAI